MSDELEFLRSQNRKLQSESTRRKEKNRELEAALAEREAALNAIQAEYATLQAEHEQAVAAITEYEETFSDDFFAEIESLTAEHEALKAAAEKYSTDPTEQQKYIQTLETQIAEQGHRATFNDVAAELEVHPDALADVWALSGYKPDGSAPDPAKIREILTPLIAGKSYLRKQQPAEVAKLAAEVAAVAPSKQSAESPFQQAVNPSNPETGVLNTDLNAGAAPVGAKTPLRVSPSLAGPGIERGRPETASPPLSVAARVANEFAASGRSDPFRL